MKSRFAGVIVTVILLGGAYAFWRSNPAPSGPPGDAPPVRGGQIVAVPQGAPLRADA